MYVDKKLGGVNAVQTLSRLNRVHPDKQDTMVLDFANDAQEIKDGFDPYYEKTILSEETDPHALYEFQRRLLAYHVFGDEDINGFAEVFFAGASMEKVYQRLNPVSARCNALEEDERADLKSLLHKYVRLYSFLSQIVRFQDPDLEKLYQFARHLRRLIEGERDELPREIQQNIDMESYRVREKSKGKITLKRGAGQVRPPKVTPDGWQIEEALEPLSRIIADLNDRFGIELTDDDRVSVGRVLAKLEQDNALDASTRVNTRENVELTFKHKVQDVFQDLIDSNFDLYKRFTDDLPFGKALRDALLDQYLVRQPGSAGTTQARRVDDPGVQVHAAVRSRGGPEESHRHHPRLPQDHRGVPEHGRGGSPDRRGRRWHTPRPLGGQLRDRRQVPASPDAGCTQRPGRPGGDLCGSPNSGRRRLVCLSRDLPAQPGTGIPEVEEHGEAARRRSVRAQAGRGRCGCPGTMPGSTCAPGSPRLCIPAFPVCRRREHG